MARRSRSGSHATRSWWAIALVTTCALATACAHGIHPNSTPGATATTAIGTGATSSPVASVDPASYAYPAPQAAPALQLTDQDGQPFELASLRGQPALVFFGYTHCPDVCPDTIGRVSQAMSSYGGPVRALFVSIDPARDTVAWLKEYSQYVPAGFTMLTGSDAQIATVASAWGARYARVDGTSPADYSMSHTADVYAVDEAGMLRYHFPYGTPPAVMTAVLTRFRSEAQAPTSPGSSPTSGAATPTPTPATAQTLQVEVASTSVWAGASIPVILTLTGPGGRLNDATAVVQVQLTDISGAPIGQPVAAQPVTPPGLTDVSWIAQVSIPRPDAYRYSVSARSGVLPLAGSSALITALQDGATPAIGARVPDVATRTLVDVGGDIRQLSTDPTADQRLYQTSTADVLAQHVPFVLVLDSTKFRVTTACGKAVQLIKYLLDRWPQLTFIHHEPFRYDIVTDTPVLQGTLEDPVLTDVATAWGLGADPWSATSMPWIFIVDGNGILRAKYQGVIGSEDVDVIVSWLEAGATG
jgi:protein SCO1/2